MPARHNRTALQWLETGVFALVCSMVTFAIPAGFVQIPAGSFTMGDTFGGEGVPDELPLHSVTVSAFYMEPMEVTKAQWDEVYTWAISHGYSFDNAGLGKATDHPITTVNWYDCIKWCNARSEKDGLTPCYYTSSAQATIYKTGNTNISSVCVNWTANGYRLPTEAEWEKAARYGVAGHRFPWSDTDTISHTLANFMNDGGESYATGTTGLDPTYSTGDVPFTSPAGVFVANGYGLYDMAGNVEEWCWDLYSDSYYSSSPGIDPRGAISGSDRAVRGGGWYNWAFRCRIAFRAGFAPDNVGDGKGLRCVRSDVNVPVPVIGPTIKANGATNNITINYPEVVSVTVAMNAGAYAGAEVDWWAIVFAHSGGWYYLNSTMQWTVFDGDLSFCRPMYQGALFNLSPALVLNEFQLPRGTYDFWFAVDYPMDGILNPNGQILLDKVTVVVR